MTDGFMGGFFQPPPEMIEALREQEAHRDMHIQDDRHELKDFLESMTPDQLVMFDGLLDQASRNPQAAPYLRGRIESIMQYKHNVCPCGRDHDPSVLLNEEDLDQVNDVKDTVNSLEEDFAAFLREYNMEMKPESVDGKQYNNLHCKGCGMRYQSMEDRMRRAPGVEGCGGCIDKMKWG